MSLYNMLHGTDPYAGLFLKILNLNPHHIARFRDCHLNADGTEIYLLTRTGGGNRTEYVDWWAKIRMHQDYISDRDDDYDSTFAITTFRVPDWAKKIASVQANGIEPETLQQKTERVMKELSTKSVDELEKDPRTKDIVEAFRQLFARTTTK
jgi:hypothetical protein